MQEFEHCRVERQGSVLGWNLDRFVVVPALSPAQNLVNPPGVVDAVLIKARSEPEMRAAMEQALSIMRSRRHLRPSQDNNFVLETSEGVQEFWAGINQILMFVGPGLVMVSLVIGGAGPTGAGMPGRALLTITPWLVKWSVS